ncbi:hypothetical protein [Burkholderia sp. Bp8998]|uniref:hypothetical protein n=1 Tax=Burkholderia sp. Bp8998 TaxID=2184557 RepID=UPI000F5AB3E6|nr:hypothetical protein [Burkholderia sp. Bp8998]
MNTSTQTAPSNQNAQPFQHTDVVFWYGMFMVTWSIVDSVVQTAIMKNLGIGATDAVILTGKMQFNPRVQLLCALLKREGDTHKDAIKLLNKTEGFAQRNTLVHGNIIVGVPGVLTFVKYDGGASTKQSFSADDMLKHVHALNTRIVTLQQLLKIADADMQLIVDATLAMVN